jgi:hypothetical protein
MDLFDFEDESQLADVNAMHLALYYNRLDIVKFFIATLKVNLMKALMDPLSKSKVNFLIKLSFKRKNYKLFFYFWEELSYLFDIQDLKEVIAYLSDSDTFDIKFLSQVLQSRSTHAIFLH